MSEPLQKFSVPSTLERYPRRERDPHQAWDAADELLLSHLETEPFDHASILILNDSFGALAQALIEWKPDAYTDSFLAKTGTTVNTGGKITPLHSFAALQARYSHVVARVPKNLSFFEDELANLSQKLKPGAKLIFGYMVKHQAKGAFNLIEKYIGKTRTSLAKKKARLIFAEFTKSPAQSPFPKSISIEKFPKPFTNHSNLFSREKLDIGTRFLLAHIPKGPYRDILDLGCANGIIGIAAKRANPDAKIIFTDESWMAVESARANYAEYFPDTEAEFHWTNSYEDGKPESVDLVLCNPPFHQGMALGDPTAFEMFKDAHRVLRPGGLLRVIGNSHLQYQVALKRIFGKVESVAKNPKFSIWDASKS